MNLKMKIMNNSNRTGGTIVIIILLLFAVVGFLVGAFLHGSRQQKAQSQLLTEGYLCFSQGKLELAYDRFVAAQKTFSLTLEGYRKVATGTFMTSEETNEVVVSICLSIAHEKFFTLENDTEWVDKAEAEAKAITNAPRKAEIMQTIATAREISKLCAAYKAGEYQKAMKDLLEVEKKSLTTDQDFFIFEIRFMIACGKAMKEPEIVNQARELLFFATTDAGIDNDKTRQLWGLLTN